MDLAGLAIPSQSRPIRFGHDMPSGVGHTDAIRVEDGQLVAAGVVSRDTAAAREIVVSARNGFPWQASIGAAVEEFEFVKENQKVIVNGREFAGPVNVVRKATLGEISFVDLGADGQTSASVAAVGTRTHARRTARWTTVSLETTPETQAAQAAEASQPRRPAAPRRRGPPVADAGDSRPPTAVAEIRAEAAAETDRDRRRSAEICAGRHPEIEAQAIREGWDADADASWRSCGTAGPTAPAVHCPRRARVNGTVLEAACLLTAKLDGVEKLFDEPDPGGGPAAVPRRDRPAGTAPGGGLGQRLHRPQLPRQPRRAAVRLRAGARGRVLDHRHRRHPLQRRQQVPAGGLLLASSGPGGTSARSGTSRDFKTVTSYRLIGKDQYEQVAPGRGAQARHAGQRDLHATRPTPTA